MLKNPMRIPNYALWPMESFGSITKFISRGSAPDYVGSSSFYAIGQRCISMDGFKPEKARPHDPGKMTFLLTPREGDVLVNSTGAGTIGRSCVFAGGGEFAVDGHVTLLRVRSEIADARWVNAILRSAWGQSHLESQCYSGSTNQVELSRARLAGTSVPLPPVAEQRKVAEVLDALEGASRSSSQEIAKLDAVRLGLVMDLLSGVEACSKDPLAGVSQVDSGVTLGSSLVGAGSKRPYLRVANVQDGYLDLSDVKTVKMDDPVSPAYHLRSGDVLMTEGGDFDKLGRGVVWRGEIPGCLYQNHIFRVRCDESVILPDFLAMYSSSWFGKNYFRLASKQSTNLASINSTQLKSFPVPVAPLEEQHRIVSIVKAHDERIAAERARLEKLRKLKTGLTDDLLTGRVRVDQLQDLSV